VTLAHLETLAHLCKPRTDHPCSNCCENVPRSSLHHLLSKCATELAFVCSEEMVSISWFALQLCQTCPISHFKHRNAAAVHIDCVTYLSQVVQQREGPALASVWRDLYHATIPGIKELLGHQCGGTIVSIHRFVCSLRQSIAQSSIAHHDPLML
jgi:hypothetical protein